MHAHQQQFIELAIRCNALRFGEFTLKSGRTSPYFFNAGFFNTGAALALLGQCYATAITEARLEYDLIFGPAYKGIPLASATAIALAEQQQRDVGYCFNRKEAKDHGEGGMLVGAPLQGRVIIVDDVITAGTAIREVMQIIRAAGAEPAAVIVGLNRQEKGQGELSAIQEIEQEFGVAVISVITLDDIIDYLRQQADMSQSLSSIEAYRTLYGIN